MNVVVEEQIKYSGENVHTFFDFGKAAYGQLEIELTSSYGGMIEVVIGEVASGDRIIHDPGWRIFKQREIHMEPGTHVYKFDLGQRHMPAYDGTPHMNAKEEYGGEITPFRYVEVNRAYGEIKVRRKAFYCDFNDNASAFESSDRNLNKVWELCKYTIKATSVFNCYIDGDRERMPYEGDTYIAQLIHFCHDTNFSVAKNTINHFFEYGQFTWPTEWLLLTPMIVRDYYLYSGDKESVEKWLPQLPAKLLPQFKGEDGLLRPTGDRIRDIVDWPETERDGYEMGEVNFVPNAYYYEALHTMAVLTQDMSYLDEAAKVRQALRDKMLKNGLFVDNPASTHTSLHTAMFALLFNIADESEFAAHQSIIKERGMACSVFGAQFLLECCFKCGMAEHGLKLIRDNTLRSWMHMLDVGTTISMEAWDDKFKPNQDWNHPWGAAPGNAITRQLCGIYPIAPGFKRFVVKPAACLPDKLFVRQPTIWGDIELRHENGVNTVKFTPAKVGCEIVSVGNDMYEVKDC